MIIVIDGPAGSGKSSTARAVADKLGIEYLDSGALYRALTVVYLKKKWESLNSFFEFLSTLSITFEYKDEMFRIWINGREVTDRLRSSEVSENVSKIASEPQVRLFVNNLMREAVQQRHYIAEGRDLGTVVFPHADVKFFMDADLNERARRRFEELRTMQKNVSMDKVRRNIVDRDKKDTHRSVDPLRKAEDAIELNTTNLTFEQQVEKICSVIKELTEL